MSYIASKLAEKSMMGLYAAYDEDSAMEKQQPRL